jgi:murein DD-endopeptidase MepM/ murein hydrolase activator NlpD
MQRTKTITTLLFVALGGWAGYRGYQYFFDETLPSVDLQGIAPDGHYAGNIQCTLVGKDNFKISEVSVLLDSVPLVSKRVQKKEFDHPFAIDSQQLANGKHTLRLEAVKGAYKKQKTVHERTFVVDNLPLQAAFVRPNNDLKVFQGRTLHLQFQVNKDLQAAHVKAMSRTFDCVRESKHSPVYEAFIPIDAEEGANEYLLSVEVTDKVGNTQQLAQKFQILPFPFKKQTLVVDPIISAQEGALGKPQQELKQKMVELAAASPKDKLWKGAFCVPLDMTALTCEYGTVRTTKERGRYMHKAVDLGGKKRSVVWAAQDGVVVVRDRYERSGNTIVIDHGCGVLTLYGHLDTFSNIQLGQRVEKGNPIGVMGKTGFATGDHVHWEMLVNNVEVDPMQWTNHTF